MRVLYEWPRCDAQLSKRLLQLYEDDCRIHFPHAFKVRAMLFYSPSTEHLSRQKIEDLRHTSSSSLRHWGYVRDTILGMYSGIRGSKIKCSSFRHSFRFLIQQD